MCVYILYIYTHIIYVYIYLYLYSLSEHSIKKVVFSHVENMKPFLKQKKPFVSLNDQVP